jgi:hypothetical protein
VHIVIGVDPEGHMYLLDLWRARASSDVWIDALCDLVLKWKPIGWAEEIRAGIGPFLDRRSRERKAYVFREQFPTRFDRAVRAQSVPRQNGYERPLCSRPRAVVSGFSGRTAELPRR